MWVSPAQCIWTAAPKIGGKFGISTTYAQLEGVFRYTLGVETPTVTTYVKQLQILATEQSRNLSAIKAAINSLSTLCSIPGDLDDLKETKFLPIKEADGSSKLARMTDAFFIADRTEYEIAFRGKIGMLDFNWNEIRKIHRLIKLLSLEGRYISIAVRETTVVELPDPEPSPTLTHEFRTRAKYFHR